MKVWYSFKLMGSGGYETYGIDRCRDRPQAVRSTPLHRLTSDESDGDPSALPSPRNAHRQLDRTDLSPTPPIGPPGPARLPSNTNSSSARQSIGRRDRTCHRIVQQTRAPLDNLAWRAATEAERHPSTLTSSRQRGISFPIYDQLANFNGALSKQLPGSEAVRRRQGPILPAVPPEKQK